MSSQNKENKKQIKNIKEQTNNKITDQEQEQQKQQIEDTQKSIISDTTSKTIISMNINIKIKRFLITVSRPQTNINCKQ